MYRTYIPNPPPLYGRRTPHAFVQGGVQLPLATLSTRRNVGNPTAPGVPQALAMFPIYTSTNPYWPNAVQSSQTIPPSPVLPPSAVPPVQSLPQEPLEHGNVKLLLKDITIHVSHTQYFWEQFCEGRRVWEPVVREGEVAASVEDFNLSGQRDRGNEQEEAEQATEAWIEWRLVISVVKALIRWKHVLESHGCDIAVREDIEQFLQDEREVLRELFLRAPGDARIQLRPFPEDYLTTGGERRRARTARSPISNIDLVLPSNAERGLFLWANKLFKKLVSKMTGRPYDRKEIGQQVLFFSLPCSLHDLAGICWSLGNNKCETITLALTPLAPFQNSYMDLLYSIFVTLDVEKVIFEAVPNVHPQSYLSFTWREGLIRDLQYQLAVNGIGKHINFVIRTEVTGGRTAKQREGEKCIDD
ncbi:hypothetical protein T439DRAFT_378468, partial [Meredithblackwellia eburnea MCA 4105]